MSEGMGVHPSAQATPEKLINGMKAIHRADRDITAFATTMRGIQNALRDMKILQGRERFGSLAIQSQNVGPHSEIREIAVGTTSLRFTIDGKLVDQGGLGFLVQADVVMSACSWLNHLDTPNEGLVHIATDERDSVDRPIVVGIDMEPPSQPLAANASYLMWNLELNTTQRFTSFNIGAEINGVKGTRNGPYSRFDFTQGANGSIAAAV
ncbi:hypothetical protein B0H14DRAFT_2610455 [Mycena olivaceomarginata]|nr:hypothetical protein B0H14DRAFT_2610455 [Mycena olivaceomarginata]